VDDPEAVGEDLLGPQHRLIEIPRVELDCSNLYIYTDEGDQKCQFNYSCRAISRKL
jgi:hypothetical protein